MPFVGSFTEFVIGGSGGIRLFFEFEKFFTRCCQKFLFKRVYPIFIPFFKGFCSHTQFFVGENGKSYKVVERLVGDEERQGTGGEFHRW